MRGLVYVWGLNLDRDKELLFGLNKWILYEWILIYGNDILIFYIYECYFVGKKWIFVVMVFWRKKLNLILSWCVYVYIIVSIFMFLVVRYWFLFCWNVFLFYWSKFYFEIMNIYLVVLLYVFCCSFLGNVLGLVDFFINSY